MSSRFLTVAEAARYLRLNPRSVYLLAQRGRDSREPRDRQVAVPGASARRLDRDERTGSGPGPGARPASDLALPEGGLFLAGSDDPALEILPDALRGQAGHPLLFIATVGRLGGLAALGQGRADVAACAHVEPASGEPDLSLHRPTPAGPPGGGGQRVRPGAGALGLDGQSAQDRGGGGSGPARSPVREPSARVGDAGVHGRGPRRGRGRAGGRRGIPGGSVDALGGGAAGPPRRGRRRGRDPRGGVGAEPRVRAPRARAVRPRDPEGRASSSRRSRPSSRPSARSGSGVGWSASAGTTGSGPVACWARCRDRLRAAEAARGPAWYRSYCPRRARRSWPGTGSPRRPAPGG